MTTAGFSFVRYLRSKTTIDDRALNKDVKGRLCETLAGIDYPIRVLEIGAGLGTMVRRLLHWGAIRNARYTLLDVDPELLGAARTGLMEMAHQNNFTILDNPPQLLLQGAGYDLTIEMVQAELTDFLEVARSNDPVDLVVASSFLDLVDVSSTLPRLFDLVKPGGLFWFCVNFDGDTIFVPETADDAHFVNIYHRSMDQRQWRGHRAGDSRTGRHLFEQLPAAGAAIVAAGASDWVVCPFEGQYIQDEGYFLHCIIRTMELELKKHSDADSTRLTKWVELRHTQIDNNQLTYIAHQLDFFGRTRS
jgi:SAM-dependent methyltransferase